VADVAVGQSTKLMLIPRRLELLLRQLDVGSVKLHFEQATATCSILPAFEETL
jgi:hypothetical protein